MMAREEKSRAGDISKSDFEELFEGRLKELQEGDITRGKVVQLTQDSVMIDIGYKSEGMVPLSEFLDKDGKPTIAIGDEITVLIERREDEHGIVRLSKAKADQFKIWDVVIESCDKGTPVNGAVTQRIKGGFYVDIQGITAFLPGSQVDLKPVRNPDKLIGQTFQFRVLKYNRRKNNVIVSRRIILEEEREVLRKTTLDTIHEGAVIEGMVKNITDYGAFIDLGGIDGLVHLTEMSWTKLKHPSQKVKVGDSIEVELLEVDPASKRISLGMKQVEPNPWEEAEKRYPKGTRIKGQVKNITDFGVFIGIEEGIDGLVHISDLSWRKIKHPSELFKKGQEVEAVVLNIEGANRRFSLSTKLLEKNPWQGVEQRYKPGMIVEGRVTSVADFGAFVELVEGLEGLVHVSELSRGKKRGADIKEGDIVEVEVLNVDPEDNKIGLSIREIREHAGPAGEGTT